MTTSSESTQSPVSPVVIPEQPVAVASSTLISVSSSDLTLNPELFKAKLKSSYYNKDKALAKSVQPTFSPTGVQAKFSPTSSVTTLQPTMTSKSNLPEPSDDIEYIDTSKLQTRIEITSQGQLEISAVFPISPSAGASTFKLLLSSLDYPEDVQMVYNAEEDTSTDYSYSFSETPLIY